MDRDHRGKLDSRGRKIISLALAAILLTSGLTSRAHADLTFPRDLTFPTVSSNYDNTLNPIDSLYNPDDPGTTPIITDGGYLIGDQYLCADDVVTDPISLGFSTAIGDSVAVSSNGAIAVGYSSMSTRTIFNVFAADLDSSTNSECANGNPETNNNFVIHGKATIDNKESYVVTWYKVQHFGGGQGDELIGTFQIVIQKEGEGRYSVIRNYETILEPYSYYSYYYPLPVLAPDYPFISGSDVDWLSQNFRSSLDELIDGADNSLAGHSSGSEINGRYVSTILGSTASNCNNLLGNLTDPNSASTISSNSSILNSDFESGVTSYGTWNFWDGRGAVDVPWNFVDPYDPYSGSNFQWMTTDVRNQLEIWHVQKSGNNQYDFRNADNVNEILSMQPYSGSNWAELGANSEGVLYQDVATIPGTTFTYSFAHHGRKSTDIDGNPQTDSMKLQIGAKPSNVQVPPDGNFGTTTNADVVAGLIAQIPSEKASRLNNTDTTGTGAFSTYSGSSSLSDSIGTNWGVYRGTYTVPAGQTCTRFAFSYVSGTNGSVGNFLDGVKFSRAVDDEFENYSTIDVLDVLKNDDQLTTIADVLDGNANPLSGTTIRTTPLGGKISITATNKLTYTRPVGVNTGFDSFQYLAADSLGNTYIASVVINFHNDAGVGIYLDQPFVQGSYAAQYEAKTENFNVPGACSINIGTISGNCTIYSDPSFASSTESSEPTVQGTANAYATGNFEITFTEPQSYVGFWWSAGNAGNTVTYYSHGTEVARYDVGQVLQYIGNSPGNTDQYQTWPNRVTALNGNIYQSKYYFGNPSGYTTYTPNDFSSVVPREPFAYVHAFAANGLSFDKIAFSGAGFELDNITVSQREIPIDPRLVKILSVVSTGSFSARTISFSQTSYSLHQGDTQQVTAIPSAGTGLITYSIGASTACTVNQSGLVTVTQSSGSCSVQASIAGDNDYFGASTTTPVTIDVSGGSTPSSPLSWNLSSVTSSTDYFATNGNSITILRTFADTPTDSGQATLRRALLDVVTGCGTFGATSNSNALPNTSNTFTLGYGPVNNLSRGYCYQWTYDPALADTSVVPLDSTGIAYSNLTSPILVVPHRLLITWPTVIKVDPRARYVQLPGLSTGVFAGPTPTSAKVCIAGVTAGTVTAQTITGTTNELMNLLSTREVSLEAGANFYQGLLIKISTVPVLTGFSPAITSDCIGTNGDGKLHTTSDEMVTISVQPYGLNQQIKKGQVEQVRPIPRP